MWVRAPRLCGSEKNDASGATALDFDEFIPVSALTGQGMDQLRAVIRRAVDRGRNLVGVEQPIRPGIEQHCGGHGVDLAAGQQRYL